MTYKAYITELQNVRPHPNADRIKLATVFGNQIVVGMDSKNGDLGIYFPSDGQLSPDFCKANNLYKKIDPVSGKNVDGYFDSKGRVRAQKFRGEKSDGFFIGLDSLKFTGVDIRKLSVGFSFTDINNVHICNKYVVVSNNKTVKQSARTAKKWSYPLFREHIDTEQLGFYVDKIPVGSVITVTEKLHGTSGRTANTLKENVENIFDKILSLFGYSRKNWVTISGTRRTVLENNSPDGFYNSNFRNKYTKFFENNLYKGETVYYEIVGYTEGDTLIMPRADATKVDSEFVAKYGKIIEYTYGNFPDQNCIYVYRITMTNEDGKMVEYSWDKVKQRCRELGINHVPELDKFIYNPNHNLLEIAEYISLGASVLDSRHNKEGVCFRVEHDMFENGMAVYKYKTFEFKVMEGIIKDKGIADGEDSN